MEVVDGLSVCRLDSLGYLPTASGSGDSGRRGDGILSSYS